MHPSTKILLYLSMLTAIFFLSDFMVLALSGTLIFIASYLTKKTFLTRCWRMKWFFLSMLLIYIMSIPGEFVFSHASWLAITTEGFQLAFQQMAKLLIALASLSILFYEISSAELMTGLYALLKPFKRIGVNVDQFVTRLLLTLQYVDDYAGINQREKINLNWQKLLQMVDIDAQQEVKIGYVHFQTLPFTRIDYFFFMLMIMLLSFIIYFHQLS